MNGAPDMHTLNEKVKALLGRYFSQLNGETHPTSLYEIVLSDAEAGLLDAMMHFTRGNQSKAARLLDMNRATIKRKLKRHHLF
jgi:Fis family transcriptional regulator